MFVEYRDHLISEFKSEKILVTWKTHEYISDCRIRPLLRYPTVVVISTVKTQAIYRALDFALSIFLANLLLTTNYTL